MTSSSLATKNLLTSCHKRHPDWDSTLCELVSKGKVSESQAKAHPNWPWFTISQHKIHTGMTKEMVIASWGKPAYVNKEGFLDLDEEWVSDNYCLGFSDGILVSIEKAPLWAASKIVSAYESNELAADKEFLGKTVMIVGYVKEIGEDIYNGFYVSLSSGSYLITVRCFFSRVYYQSLVALRKGQKVVIKGIGLGKSIFSIDFGSCRLFWVG